MSFWDIVWFILISFAFMAYLMVMFAIITDLFRDPDASGIVKAVWIIALIFAPFVTAVVYLIVRGKGMGERQLRARGGDARAAGQPTSGRSPARRPRPTRSPRPRRCSTPRPSPRRSTSGSRRRP